MIAVSDTSPVLNLARIGRLEILASLYNQVLIPPAVFAELVASRGDLAPSIDLASISWIQIAAPQNQQRVRDLREDLDPGEAEAIVLAIERQADLGCSSMKGADDESPPHFECQPLVCSVY